MKKLKVMILSLALVFFMTTSVFPQKSEKVKKEKKKITCKIDLKGLEILKDLHLHLEDLEKKLECLTDLDIHIDLKGLSESLKDIEFHFEGLEALKDIDVHLEGLEAL